MRRAGFSCKPCTAVASTHAARLPLHSRHLCPCRFVEGFLRRLLDPHDALARKARAGACFYVVRCAFILVQPASSWLSASSSVASSRLASPAYPGSLGGQERG